VELAGILGAVLAIPVAGIIQIIARDIWDIRRGRLKTEPTVGEDQTPVDATEPVQGRAPMSPVGTERNGAMALHDGKGGPSR
jgi:hypothetical protein